jgi:hypothetical protein
MKGRNSSIIHPLDLQIVRRVRPIDTHPFELISGADLGQLKHFGRWHVAGEDIRFA